MSSATPRQEVDLVMGVRCMQVFWPVHEIIVLEEKIVPAPPCGWMIAVDISLKRSRQGASTGHVFAYIPSRRTKNSALCSTGQVEK